MSRLVVVCTAAGQPQAALIKSRLEANHIPVTLSQESAGATFGFTVGAMGVVEVLVAEEDAEAAKAILEDSNLKIQDSNPKIQGSNETSQFES
jgi:hypothetical protein